MNSKKGALKTVEKKDAWRFLPIETNDGPTNMAKDEAILEARIKGIVPNTVRLYQWSPSTVTIGKHQSVSLEVDDEEINKRGFQLVRRISGGGAVLHAENMEITYSVVAKRSDLVKQFPDIPPTVDGIYHVILMVIQKTMDKISLATEKGVIHCPALFIGDKKFSGNAQCIKKNVILQHGTILLTVDPVVMYSVLKPPEGVTKGRMVRSVKAKVMGIEDHLGKKIDPLDFNDKYKQSFSEMLDAPLVDGNLTKEEEQHVVELRKKYESDKWRMKYK
ncbi:MAG: biotin/lipoate A/B protein ligase family protein [Candidatus Hodarchaeota archaeon]